MSLDLSNKNGRAHNTAAFAAADLAGVVAATFDSGDLDTAGKFLLQVDTSAGDIDATTLPVTMVDAAGQELLEDGVVLTLVKVTPDSNKITFNDPVTGIAYTYLNRYSETMTLVFDTSSGAGQWVFDF